MDYAAAAVAQEDGNWVVSTRERGPTMRSLVGRWWQDHWEVRKVLYCKHPDGRRQVLLMQYKRVRLIPASLGECFFCSVRVLVVWSYMCTPNARVPVRSIDATRRFLR